MAKPIPWADIIEDDNGVDCDYLLPPKQVIGPDENGIKKVVEYKYNDEGDKVKFTTTTRIRHVRLKRNAADRRYWPKFGDAVHEDVGARLTMVSTENIFLERPRAHGEEVKNSGDSNKASALIMVCRTCGKKGDHWTAKCPYKDISDLPDGKEPSEPKTPPVDGLKPKYVSPGMRRGLRGVGGQERVGTETTRRRNEENSVRVTNLSEDTREADLEELFGQFGQVSRVFVARDHRAGGISRGFGFVNFVRREDGERAIAKLDGYGYDNLILGLGWAAPRAK